MSRARLSPDAVLVDVIITSYEHTAYQRLVVVARDRAVTNEIMPAWNDRHSFEIVRVHTATISRTSLTTDAVMTSVNVIEHDKSDPARIRIYGLASVVLV